MGPIKAEVGAEATASSATNQVTWPESAPITREEAAEAGAASNVAKKGIWLETVQTGRAAASTGVLTRGREGTTTETTPTATGAEVADNGASQLSSREAGTESEGGRTSTNADC